MLDEQTISAYYRGLDRQAIIDQYHHDLDRAEHFGAEYVVYHVSDISLEETFTYRWDHTHEEVIDAAVECINTLLDGRDYHFTFLVENQWWPGFTFTDPALTERLLAGIHYENKGIMWDTGHFLHTNTKLRSQADALAYMNQKLDEHGELASFIRGMHLHQSLSGAYVEKNTGTLPRFCTQGTYWERYGNAYGHILEIDKHEPWTDPAICDLIRRVNPSWINNELASPSRAAHTDAVLTQLKTLRKGGLID